MSVTFPILSDLKYPNLGPNGGLVGAWSPCLAFDTSSTVFDLSERRNPGTMVTMDPATDWTTSSGYPVLDFDGNSDYVNAPMPVIAMPLTIIGWGIINNLTSPGAQNLLSYENEGHGFLLLHISGSVWAGSFDPTFDKAASATTIAAGQVVQLAAIFHGPASRKVAVNGRIEAENTTSITPALTAPNVRLGYRTHSGGSGQFWSGGIFDARIYSRALTAGDIADDYRLGPGGWATPRRRRSFASAAGAASYTLTASVGSYSITGNSTSLLSSHKITSDVGSYSLTGTATGLLHGYKSTTAVGSYSTTGAAASLLQTHKVTADVGSYSLSGTATGLLQGHKLTVSVGSLAITGNISGLLKGSKVTAAVGSYALTGADAGLLQGHRIAPSVGSYSITGSDPLLSESGAKTIFPAVGSHAITGNDVTLLYARRLTSAAGSYSSTGSGPSLLLGRIVQAATGSYALSGQAAIFPRTRIMSAGTGSYALTGISATLGSAAQLVTPGIEWAVKGSRVHWVVPGARVHWTADEEQ